MSKQPKPKEKWTRAELEEMERYLRKETTKHMITTADSVRREMTEEERKTAIQKVLDKIKSNSEIVG